MPTASEKQFVLCVRNDGCEDLELRKVYEVIVEVADAHDDHVRVIDESGDDYLYPADYFVAIDLPIEAKRSLASSR